MKSSSSYCLKSLDGFDQLPSVQPSWVCFILQRAQIQKTRLLSLLKQISLINRFIFSVFVLHTNQFNNNLSFAVNSVNFLLPTSIIGAVLFWTKLRAQKLKVVVLCGSSAIRIQWRNLRSIYQTWESQRHGYGSQWTQYLCQISILLINMQGAGYSGEPWDRKSRRRMIANMKWRWLWRWCLEKLEAAPPLLLCLSSTVSFMTLISAQVGCNDNACWCSFDTVVQWGFYCGVSLNDRSDWWLWCVASSWPKVRWQQLPLNTQTPTIITSFAL